ncbi:MAG: hypothetical protein ABGW90_11265 [Martelella sp.]
MTRFDKLIDITPDPAPQKKRENLPAWPMLSFVMPFFAGNICADFSVSDGWRSIVIEILVITIAVYWQSRILRRWQRKSVDR